MPPPPPDNHVQVVLHRGDVSDFYLELPVSVVVDLVLKPLKFLRYLGWSVLSVSGDLLDARGVAVDLESTDLIAKSTYWYCRQETTNDLLKFAIDPEVIKLRSAYSCSSARITTFRQDLERRDMLCIFTGLRISLVGMHIIPHSRGDEWINIILANRPKAGEALDDFNGIDDVRNGILGNSVIHSVFDARTVVVLKTPNPMLCPEDVQPRAALDPKPGTEYPPDGSRYTLQWIVPSSDPLEYSYVPKNLDARFVTGTGIPRPSDLLLHYNYGAAAVKNWGQNVNILVERPNIPRPKPEEPDSMRKQYKAFNHNAFCEKRTGRTEGDAHGSGSKENGGSGGPVEDVGWNEDDVMLLLWSNTPQAIERFRTKEREKKNVINQWRLSVGVD